MELAVPLALRGSNAAAKAERCGLSNARNSAVGAASAQVLAFLDDDTVAARHLAPAPTGAL